MGNCHILVFSHPSQKYEGWENLSTGRFPLLFWGLGGRKRRGSAGKTWFSHPFEPKYCEKRRGNCPIRPVSHPSGFFEGGKSSGIDGFTSSMNSEGWESVCFAEFPIPRDNSRSFAFQFRFLADARNDRGGGNENGRERKKREEAGGGNKCGSACNGMVLGVE